MIRLLTLAAAVSLGLSPAFAFHCPADMAKIDNAVKTAQLSDAQKKEVAEYRAQGETLHKAGKHQESIDTLAKAMKILKIQ
ncbi:hypothetical protein QNA08_09905 [Chelatococcus sp. SYSU_G07232]|uniref:Uncharacterized protein n=1 Tax=Chelatococcus albus TaxID=3047466 RepID=A0ABT7AGR9_9HYPH|nr:hypothetical protein [Chelatococcus sp. SYSU_G07232]MDJ1158548.1 hypothetical protein [Chelatococcus sp. SYSU_G07232]